jgi:hypothetical protein
MKSFLEGRPTAVKEGGATIRTPALSNHGLPIFKQAIREPATPVESAAPASPHNSSHGQVKVEAIEEQGIVRSIVVTCACGERIEVHCGY